MADAVFHRLALAEQMSRRILATSALSAASSGLFLAAPRRTGKSTFLREDLSPALLSAGAYVLYVDLWADKKVDPGEAVVAVVREALSKFDGVVTKLARTTGLDKISLPGVGFSLTKVGLGGGVSISSALSALSDEIKKPIVLIIDEAQHAITTDKGYDALFALKAARDELNSAAHYGLRIVATGSNRDKLAMLRNSRDQAFFGAPLVEFPPLGFDYVKWFCDEIDLPGKLMAEEVEVLFDRAERRPEILYAAADELRYDFDANDENVSDKFAGLVAKQIKASDTQTLRVIQSLTPIQSAVLFVLVSRRDEYAPFEEATMDAYRQVLTKIAPREKLKLEVPNVQQALISLQEKSLVWREKRGVYALEDSSTLAILAANNLLIDVPETFEQQLKGLESFEIDDGVQSGG